MFNGSFANIVTITFSALVVIELLNINSCITKFNWKMVVLTVLTIVIYIVTIAFFRSNFDTSYITWPFALKVLLLTVIAWVPLYIV